MISLYVYIHFTPYTCSIPCRNTFIAHYEQALADPQAFLEPLSAFLELSPASKLVSFCLHQMWHMTRRNLTFLFFLYVLVHFRVTGIERTAVKERKNALAQGAQAYAIQGMQGSGSR